LVDAMETHSEAPTADVATRSLDSLDGWFQAAARFPLLTAEEEKALARTYDAGRRATMELAEGQIASDGLRRKLNVTELRGQQARLLLICSNLRLVAAMTRAYHSEGLERVDLMQEGVVGLMRAVEKFDWRLGYKFSTYATHWIRQATQRGIDMQGRLIRLPVHMLDRLRGVKREARRMEIRLGREPTIFELGETVGIDPAELAFLRDLEDVASLDQPVGRDVDATVLGELLASEEDRVEDVVERIFRSEQISRWLDCLTERERMVIERRFGLRDDHVETLEEIGRDLGVTRERIRQIEAKALEKLEETAGQEQ
jgi:RNA polymerase primary sigma factor